MEVGSDIINIFTPIHLIKGTDGKGRSKMRLAGIASTSSQDADGEFLDPAGFELDYFLKSGFMNWNHQASKDPLAIIGKPTEAVTKAEGLYIACDLFENSPRAKEVYELAEIMEAQGIPLGFSIEGKVLERDAKNPKIVKKAKITGCAITANPKNTDAVAEIIKGHSFGTLSAYDNEDEESREKAMSAGSPSGQALAKESLDDSIKVLTYGEHNIDKKLTKGEVLVQIFERNPEISIKEGEELYNLISQIEKSIIMSKPAVTISAEAIEKAYATLGLSKPESSTENNSEESELEKSYQELSKAMDGTDYKKMSKEDKSDLKKKMAATLQKMEDDESEEGEENDEEEDTEKGAGVTRGTALVNSVTKAKDTVSKGVSAEAIEAAMTVFKAAGLNIAIVDNAAVTEPATIAKAESDDLNKDIDIKANNLIKGEFERIEKSFTGQIDASVTLIKGLMEDMEGLRGEIEELGSRSPGARSVTASAAPIEKSWNNDLENNNAAGAPTLSISRDKRKILDLLEKSYFNDSDELINPTLSKEAMVFESASQMSPGIIAEMKKQGYNLVG